MKIVYINKETGEEVHYGDEISYQKEGVLTLGGRSYKATVCVPILESTIVDLIKKGIIIRKEVPDEGDNIDIEPTLEDKIKVLIASVSVLLDKVSALEDYVYNKKVEE